MPKKLTETASLTAAAASEAKNSGRMMIQFISPGWGSSGYYSNEVLEQAVADQVIPSGTHMYADHPTDAEAIERPGRSIKDLMSVTTEAARLATADDVASWGADLGALVGEVQVVPQWRDLVETVKDNIGVSILGSATDIVRGEAEGRSGGIIEGLVAPVSSVDWVTRAGRGGRVLSVLESARATQRAIAHGVSEATVNDTREALQNELRDAYGGEKKWVYVRDFDDTTVWFEIEADGDESGIYGQTYTDTDGVVELTGDRAEVRVVTTYVPATRPDSTTTTTESEEDTMPKIQIEESEHQRLTETAGRVDALQKENDTLKAENGKLKEEKATSARTKRATEIVEARAAEAKVEFSPLELRGLMVDLPLTESGDLDEAKFTETVDTAAAEAKKATAGGVRGFGQSAPQSATESTRPTTTPWGRPLAEQKGA